MHHLRQGKLVRVHFLKPVTLPALEGLTVREQAETQASFEYTGPLPQLMRWLAEAPLDDVRVEPLGLAPIYFRFHGDAA